MATATWHGLVIAESLFDPTLLNEFDVYAAEITAPGKALDASGRTGRWHLYWVKVDEPAIERLEARLRPGWYAHFWRGDDLLIVFGDARFLVALADRETWAPAIEHGRRRGIPQEELDFGGIRD